MLGPLLSAWSRLLDRGPANPAFPLTYPQADQALARMADAPIALTRPVVVLAGYRAWRFMPRSVVRPLARATRAEFLPISYALSTDIHAIARRVVERVRHRWPSPDPARSIDVDVVAVSMGGLVARVAAAIPPPGRRLNIARLFTLATPHQGAKLALRLAPDSAARAMRPGSDFLAALDRDLASATYTLTCYARLRDTWVGATRTAPPGRRPIWTTGPALLSHLTITQDRRIIADIARRLRGEPPLAEANTQPPPTD